MSKVQLKGPKSAQWNIGGSFFAGESIQDLTIEQIKKHKDVILEIFDKELVIEEPKKLLIEEDLFKLKKDEQISLLKELGVKKIPQYEKGRVKAILAAQGVNKK